MSPVSTVPITTTAYLSRRIKEPSSAVAMSSKVTRRSPAGRAARLGFPQQSERRHAVQILVERDVFADAVAWTARALPARPTVPVLAGMRLHAEADVLTLSSFDYDVSAQAKLPVTTTSPGTALVSGRLLAEISQPAVAAGRDDTLPSLTGVRIEIEGESITLISTDRYRLAVRELRWSPSRPDLSAAVLVPAKALTDTARSLTSAAEVSIALALPGEDASAPGAASPGAYGAGGGDGMIGFEAGVRGTPKRRLSGGCPRCRPRLPS